VARPRRLVHGFVHLVEQDKAIKQKPVPVGLKSPLGPNSALVVGLESVGAEEATKHRAVLHLDLISVHRTLHQQDIIRPGPKHDVQDVEVYYQENQVGP